MRAIQGCKDSPTDTIRWQGVRQVLDHGWQRSERCAPAMNVNKETRS